MARHVLSLVFILLTVSQGILVMADGADTVSVSPGKFDHKLGDCFPREDCVKLDYQKSTVLTDRIGELLFNVSLTTFNYTSGTDTSSIVKSISIFIPPEFTISSGVASIWTSFTNDYNPSSIFLATASSNDPIAPNWSIVSISNLNITKSTYNVARRTFIENKNQYIRVFNVTSPSRAGRYFFKVFIGIGQRSYSIGAGNFPTIVVEADLNPAYISGIVKYGGSLHRNLYGAPLDSSTHPDGTVLLPSGYGGRIYAEGLTASGQRVEAQAYFNASAQGVYTLYGLAPATYNFTVEAAGYPPQRYLNVATVTYGQSLENVDLYVTEGVNVTGTVRSKHGFGEIPWGYSYNLTSTAVRRVVRIDVTDLNNVVLASSPLRLFDKSLMIFRPRDTLDPLFSDFRFSIGREVSWDGHIPQDYANYTSGIPSGDYYAKAYVTNYVQIDPAIVHTNNATKEVRTVIDLQRTSYFEITVNFKDRDEDIQLGSTFVGGYLYLEVVDAAGSVVGFNISYVPVRSTNFTMQVRGIDIWSRLFSDQSKRIAWTYSHDYGLLPNTYTVNALFINQTADFIALNALILASPELRMIYPAETSPLASTFSSRTLESTNRQTPLYFQLRMIRASTGGFCNSPAKFSFELIRGGAFNITLFAVDWQKPRTNRNWVHPGSGIRIDIQTSEGALIDSIYATQPFIAKHITISTLGEIELDGIKLTGRALGLKSGAYILKVYTSGYLDDSTLLPIIVPVRLGDVSDARINLLRGAGIDVSVIFKTENLMDSIDNRLPYAHPINNIDATPVRIEVFDGSGEFVAANLTYVDAGCNNLEVHVDGFNNYHGSPRLLWTNFYDTTDAKRMSDSGLHEGVYDMRVSISGYYQTELFRARIDSGNVESRPIVSLIIDLERLGYLHGIVTWVDWAGAAMPLSWATVTAYNSMASRDTYNSFTYSLDGFYEMWLLPGEYDFGINHPGFRTIYLPNRLYVGLGSTTSIDFFMN